MDQFEEEGAFKVTNYRPHPTNERYIVVHFASKEEGDHFEELLKKDSYEYERDHEANEDHRHYFAVRKYDFKNIRKLIYLTHGKFRKPFISNVFFRWFLVLFVLGIIILSIIGYFTRSL